jgi:hypothetical protein
MNTSPELPVALYKTLNKHFVTALANVLPCRLIQEERKPEEEKHDRCDLYIVGPIVRLSDVNTYRFNVTALVMVKHTGANLYRGMTLVGQVMSAFVNLPVIGENGESYDDCLNIEGGVSEIRANTLGMLSPSEWLGRYPVSASYVYIEARR